jgi:hypothetical protein
MWRYFGMLLIWLAAVPAASAGCPPAVGWPQTATLSQTVAGYRLTFGPEVFATQFPEQNVTVQIGAGTITVVATGAQQLCDIGTPPPPTPLVAELGAPQPGTYTVNVSATFQPSGTVRTGQFQITIPGQAIASQSVDSLSRPAVVVMLAAMLILGLIRLRSKLRIT